MKTKYLFSALIVGIFAWLFTINIEFGYPEEQKVEECDYCGGAGGQPSVEYENYSNLGGSPTDLENGGEGGCL